MYKFNSNGVCVNPAIELILRDKDVLLLNVVCATNSNNKHVVGCFYRLSENIGGYPCCEDATMQFSTKEEAIEYMLLVIANDIKNSIKTAQDKKVMQFIKNYTGATQLILF